MLSDLLNQALGGNEINQLAKQIGADENTTASAVSAALPLLLGALSRNASQGQGAASIEGALDRDHDGGILDNLAGFLGQGNAGPGQAILGHLLGGKQTAAASALSRSSGLDMGAAVKLLAMLAPIVMGALGRTKRQQGLGLEDLIGTLQGQSQQARQQAPDLGLLSILDTDGDGNVMDDVAKLGGSLLGGFLGGKK